MNQPLTHISLLNEVQQKAVTAEPSHLLILAGAGSGKTRVLVHRIAWLLQYGNITPFNILAVTFTNKAANEMRERLNKLVTIPTSNMWVGTFHGIAHRLLRIHWNEAGLSQNFQIIDSEDQKRLIKKIHKTLNLDDKKWPVENSQWFINNKKDEGLRPDKINSGGDLITATLLKVYTAYTAECKRNSLLDFAELLLCSYELMHNCPELLVSYQQRFQHILIDEFQDTNKIQYLWIHLLASGGSSHLTIVGDDDQSIYGWRGAKVENMQRIKTDFPDIKVICLEQNYRSSGNILSAASSVIANNCNRWNKTLWTTKEPGELINLYVAINEIDEAKFVVKQIHKYLHTGIAPNDIAILYRSNAQSRVFEEELLKEGIPYTIYGGYRFFERAEIKDTLAYLRLLVNPNDDASFERIINFPARGIGDVTLSLIREKARADNISLWYATQSVISEQKLSSRMTEILHSFIELIKNLAIEIADMPLDKQINQVLYRSGLYNHFKDDNTTKGDIRTENLEELINAARQFVLDTTESPPLINAFLARVALESDAVGSKEAKNTVQIMTLHSAKGLEFPILFLVGMEMGLFPHHSSLNNPSALEEERRLCYVGITRAMSKLFLSCAQVRRLRGIESYCMPSKFLREIPPHLLNTLSQITTIYPEKRSVSVWENNKTASTTKIKIADATDSQWKIGQKVSHPKFGTGIILEINGKGDNAKIKIKFEQWGIKLLVAMYANLR